MQRQALESRWEKLVEQHLLAIPDAGGFVAQYQFYPARRWRFDFGNPTLHIAVEVEGGVWSAGKSGHTSGVGYRNNCEKYNRAALLGRLVLRFTPDQIQHGHDIALIEEAIALRREREAMQRRRGNKGGHHGSRTGTF
jgi:hypothetical protein